MSKRIAGIALLMMVFAPGANAETFDLAEILGDNRWTLFRPEPPDLTLFDLDYLTHSLHSERTGLGLRFQSSSHLAINLQMDPFTQRSDLIGPIYDFGIGATVLELRYSF